MIFKVEKNNKTEWFEGSIMLCYDDKCVACIDGELLEAFKSDEYVIDNRLVD